MPNGAGFALVKGRYRHEAAGLVFAIDAADGGRPVELSLDGHNVLVERATGSPAYGSSFWPSPQRDWDWPPPAAFESMPWRARLETDALLLQSRVEPALGLSASQRVRVAQNGVSFEYTLTNHGASRRSVAPWQNTRVRPRGLTFYPSPEATLSGSTLSIETRDGVAWLRHDPHTMTANAKSFADGAEGWVAHLDGDVLFLKTFPEVPRAQQAPTEAQVEIYVDHTGLFVEVEQQGAYVPLEPRESSAWTTRWQLLRAPQGMSLEPGSADLLAWVRGLT